MDSRLQRASPLRRLLTALALALPVLLCVGAETAYAANACSAKGGIGGTGFSADGGVGGTGSPVEGGIGGSGSPVEGGIGGSGSQAGGVGGSGGSATGGIGGTGAQSRGGVGGTGAIAGGIGGTGRVGVVGTITGFASVCVNGLEVHYAPETPVVSNGLPASVADLAMGQVVTIEANAAGYQAAGELGGVRISILNAVAGPVSAVDGTARKITVLGQTVRVTPQTLVADGTGIRNFSALAAGALVRVSGLRLSAGDIVASRIDVALSLDQASVVGPVTQSDANGFSIYGLHVAYADVTGTAAISGGEAMVSGRVDGVAMRPERIALAPSTNFAQDIDRLVLEGYIGSASAGEISVGGVKVAVSASTVIGGTAIADLQADVRVQVTAHVAPDHSIVADSILLRRDPLAPPAPASIMPPPRGGGVSFNRPGDGRVLDANDDHGAVKLTSLGGTGSGAATTGGAGTGINTGGTSGGTLGGGSGTGVSGGGTITPGGGTITPGGGTTKTPPVTVAPVILPRPHGFDAMDFRPLGLPRVVSR